ncbi:DUF1015 domain-containing protein [Pedobacter boryungensis]|uniref:DUF1015 domain-containing protein n=1 Tax=Pedobacter boryungensis TaxID=869962 RepID=A0ABX2DA71_9SPHI|nr:DUF1015 domain-containing protein [Pedobacter boryungensis]NQX30946.1 DUF1015 domain-containing protein [Pedobacter boryungensis]
MPRIKPFCALKPAPTLLNTVVTRPLENYGIGQAKLIASENPTSFLHLINPELDNPYLRGSRQELIYKKVAENLEGFIEKEILIAEENPCIYIYQIVHDGLVQTGIWTLTHINDYLEGNIKKHELTVEAREKSLAEYLQQTGLDANPVLITYHPNQIIQQLLEKYKALKADIDFTFVDGTQHRIWKIDRQQDLDKIVNAFAEMPEVYIADGHHRAASMAKMGLHKRTVFSEDNAQFNYFTTVYMDTEEVKVLAYHRLVRDLAGLTEEEFFQKISADFEVKKVDQFIKPTTLHHFAMYLKSGWYTLIAKQHTYTEDPVNILDVSILQNFVLGPILNVKDPRKDARIKFEGEKTPINILERQIANGINVVAFILAPIAIEQLIKVADANKVMPPKSTWVEPKFLVGLLTHYFNK